MSEVKLGNWMEFVMIGIEFKTMIFKVWLVWYLNNIFKKKKQKKKIHGSTTTAHQRELSLKDFTSYTPSGQLLAGGPGSDQRGPHSAEKKVQGLDHQGLIPEDHLHSCVHYGEGELPALGLTERRDKLPLRPDGNLSKTGRLLSAPTSYSLFLLLCL